MLGVDVTMQQREWLRGTLLVADHMNIPATRSVLHQFHE
jgi:hypothetical protein